MKALKTLRLAENAIREVPPAMIAELRARHEMDLTNSNVAASSRRSFSVSAAVSSGAQRPLRSRSRPRSETKGTPIRMLAHFRKMPRALRHMVHNYSMECTRTGTAVVGIDPVS